MTSTNSYSLSPGEIKLGFIPIDWPLTPLGEKKNPYVSGWQNKPLSVNDIKEYIEEGNCKAIGLLSGPCYQKPFGYVWVDIDGKSVYQLVEEIAKKPFNEALPDTLTICSGKEGRERKLYKVNKDDWSTFARNKYAWLSKHNSDTNSNEKLELLWKRHQGVLMGLHPDTDGYYTKENQGFEWVDKIPTIPGWLLDAIINKNIKLGKPAEETTRLVNTSFAINQKVNLDTDIKKAIDAAWGMPPEAADDYDIWIIVGQTFHELDDSLLDEWDEWSKQSSKYVPGECFSKWQSFSKGGGRTIGTLVHIAKENGYVVPAQDQSHKAFPPDDELIMSLANVLDTMYEKEEYKYKKSGSTKGRFQAENIVNNKKEKKTGEKNIKASDATELILQQYKGNLRYCPVADAFYVYQYNSPGLWCELNEIEMKGEIRHKLNQMRESVLPSGYSLSLIHI